MEKIWRELPDMNIMIAFIGIDFAGAKASSQDFLSFRRSVSDWEGGLRAVTCCCCFWSKQDVSELYDRETVSGS